MQIRFKIILTTYTQISSEWEVGAKRPTTHLIDRLNLSLHTKFQSIHPPPHPSNKASSLNLICISGQNPKWANPQPQSGHMPTPQVGKHPFWWANAHISCGQMPKEYNPNPNPNLKKNKRRLLDLHHSPQGWILRVRELALSPQRRHFSTLKLPTFT